MVQAGPRQSAGEVRLAGGSLCRVEEAMTLANCLMSIKECSDRDQAVSYTAQ